MAEHNNNQQAPFWDFVRGFDGQGQHHGAGVDHHPAGPPPFPSFGGGIFGPPGPPPPGFAPPPFAHPMFAGPWGGPRGHHGHGPLGHGPHGMGGGHRGGRGRHCRRSGGENEGEERNRSRTASPGHEQEGEHEHNEGENAGASGGEGHEHGHRGPRGCGRRGGRGHGPRGGHFWGEAPRGGWGRGPHGGPFGGPGGAPFDLSGLFASLNANNGNPWANMFRQFAEQAGLAQPQAGAQRSGETLVNDEVDEKFTPPIDIFSTETAYVLHVALPGAKKEDVGVNWDAEKGELNVAGVVYRKGDEDFLKTLSTGERKVGMFERSVKLPPGNEEKEEVDEDGITAKLEDGVLVVTVPKVEKEWTDVKRVDVN